MIKIWNREEDLKGLDKGVWFEAYPESKYKTLALIDEIEVVFIEDLRKQGFSGDNDISVVEAYIADKKAKEEEYKKKEKETPPPPTIEALHKIIKEQDKKIETLSETVESLMIES